MALNPKKRLAVAGAVLGASLFTLAIANAQIDPATGAPTTPGISPTPPGVSPQPGTTPSPYDTGMDGGTGGAGLTPSYPSPFEMTDAGLGGSGGLMPSPILGDLDAGLR